MSQVAPAADLDVRVSAAVVVVGDGPAGTALATALTRLGVDVVLVGPDEPWEATYTAWVDELESLELLAGADPWSNRLDRVAVHFGRERTIERAYGVLDNRGVRAFLRDGVRHERCHVESVGDVDAILIVDATGWPSKLDRPDNAEAFAPVAGIGWQTAFGVLLAEPPQGALGVPTMMDFSDPGTTIEGRPEVPTFAYSIPVGDRWLVEETVLTASPAVAPELLAPVLAARLGVTLDDLLDRSTGTESVRIPMGVPPDPGIDVGGSSIVRFGAAAGMIHPATGYSVASAFAAADRVATAISEEIERSRHGTAFDAEPVRAAVWPVASRRTRRLHDYGQAVLADLDRPGVQEFFDTFFDLPVETWSGYMRIDTPPVRLARVMTAMFRRAPWTLRAKLMAGGPKRLIRVLKR